MIARDLANAIAGTELAHVTGTFHRHAHHAARELKGSTGGGRWGPENGFPVLYLGQPIDSVVVEAYRRYVDPFPGMRPEFVSARRVLLTAAVDVDHLLDLRVPEHLEAVGLDIDALSDAWAPCERVARAAHQLGLHGIVTPAATGLGLTLALFENHLPATQWPTITNVEHWDRLPADPRKAAKP